MPNFEAIAPTVAEIWQYFDFSTWRPPPSWIFQISILTVGWLKRAELRRRAKFGRNWSKRGRDVAIFRFFKTAAATILDFFKFEIFYRSTAQEGRTASRAKFGRNPSNHSRDMVIFRFFKMAAATILDFANFKF